MRWCFKSLGCMVIGGLCILYCLAIMLFMGYGTRFFLIWGVIGSCFVGLGWLLGHGRWLAVIPGWFKMVATGLICLGLLLFLVVEGLIVSRFTAQAPVGADYCIILGAQMKSHGPSDVLRRRLNKAIGYLEENPQTKVIVTGGQGANEPVTEAQGMSDYLMQKGIEEWRIIREDRAENTVENLRYSSEFLDPAQDNVVLVTNNFHMFRAEKIAGKLGYAKLYGLAADSYPLMIPNNMLREFLGVVKDFLVGNM